LSEHHIAIPSLTILPEIESHLFPLRAEELDALEKSVLQDGIRDPLIVWNREGSLILVDGHHRYRLAQKHGLNFEIRERVFRDIDEVLDWIDFNQLARRNMTDEQRALVLGRLYHREKMRAPREIELSKIGGHSDLQIEEVRGHNATARKIAAQTGVGEKTVRRAADFAEAFEKVQEISPKAAQKILLGEVEGAIKHLPVIARREPEQLVKIAKKIEESNKPVSIKDLKQDIRSEEWRKPELKLTSDINDLDIRQGDFREVLADIPDKSVDIILTDPPYPKEYLSLWRDLGKFAARVLKDTGVLVAYSGQYHLPEVIRALEVHLDWWWLMAVVHRGSSHLTILGPKRKVIPQFKALVVFVPRGGGISCVVKDLIEGAGSEKDSHTWQQPVEEAKEILRRLAPPGALVVDPFAGSGTVGKAAMQLGMKFVGAEVLYGTRQSDDEVIEESSAVQVSA